jgi:hypothetical protein
MGLLVALFCRYLGHRADYLGWTDRTFDLSQMWPQQMALSFLYEREAPAERNGHGK